MCWGASWATSEAPATRPPAPAASCSTSGRPGTSRRCCRSTWVVCEAPCRCRLCHNPRSVASGCSTALGQMNSSSWPHHFVTMSQTDLVSSGCSLKSRREKTENKSPRTGKIFIKTNMRALMTAFSPLSGYLACFCASGACEGGTSQMTGRKI